MCAPADACLFEPGLRATAAHVGRPSHAGTYVWGFNGSNDCPEPSLRIIDAPTCERAATAAGKAYDGVVAESAYPRGCALYAPTFARAPDPITATTCARYRTRARARVKIAPDALALACTQVHQR